MLDQLTKLNAYVRPVFCTDVRRPTSFAICLTNNTLTSAAQLVDLVSPHTDHHTLQFRYGQRYYLSWGEALTYHAGEA